MTNSRKELAVQAAQACGFNVKDCQGQKTFILPEGWTKKQVHCAIWIQDSQQCTRAIAHFSKKRGHYSALEFIERFCVEVQTDNDEGCLQAFVFDNKTGQLIYEGQCYDVSGFLVDTETNAVLDDIDPDSEDLGVLLDDGIYCREFDEERYQEAYDSAANEACEWLDKRYPDWQNPMAYWN